MSDSLPPLGNMTLDEAHRMRGELMRAMATGALNIRNTDGSAVTYRTQAEMRTALTEIGNWISAFSAAIGGANGFADPTLRPVRTLRMIPSSGWR